ncbi:hypothetical protein [Tenggerimyces flavus]|uniref:Integral membrane protein n=1 Tax=Tenggerimyces flavus TaxID=1708749 RepID=A0ABV7Y361_9ACTN|nr:hypothetical protein [Tenggerimyces flavus]MBM7790347.1 hypothetical protein [Tenggerimyces flavus]
MSQSAVDAREQERVAWWRVVTRRWPAAVGVAVAALSISELVNATVDEGVQQALIIAIPVLVYLTAAVIDRPKSSWPVLAVTLALIFGFGVFDIDPIIGLTAASAVVLVVGVVHRLWRGSSAPAIGQILGAVGFGTAAVLALAVSPTVGGFLVGFGLLGHATWDIVHHRRNIIVARSLAEFCAVLDTLVGMAVLALTIATMT